MFSHAHFVLIDVILPDVDAVRVVTLTAAGEVVALLSDVIQSLWREPETQREAILTQSYVTNALVPIPSQVNMYRDVGIGYSAGQQLVWLNTGGAHRTYCKTSL